MKPPAFQFYADDFLAGTFAMTNEERGLYITLLCRQWTQGHVTRDEVARLGSTVVQPSIDHVLTKFLPDADGKLKNARLEVERGKQNAFRALQSAKGKASAEARSNRGSTVVQPSYAPKPNSPSPSPSPSSELLTELGESAAPLTPSPSPKASRPKAAPRQPEKTDDEWRAELAADPTYAGISIATEWGKMARWCEVNRKLPSRKRFINWIGRCERPMGQAPAGTPVKAFISPEPANWRGIVDREFPQSTYAGITTPWAKLSASDRDVITQAVQPYLPAA